MTMSGWRIYNASPLFEFKVAKEITLGGWLGGALQWHFAAMWLLAANGLVNLLCNFGTGRIVRKFFPLSPRAVVADLAAAFRGRLSHADLRQYNAVQRAAYLFAIIAPPNGLSGLNRNLGFQRTARINFAHDQILARITQYRKELAYNQVD
jgi:thiosulfate reductase cytochrome b subunit